MKLPSRQRAEKGDKRINDGFNWNGNFPCLLCLQKHFYSSICALLTI